VLLAAEPPEPDRIPPPKPEEPLEPLAPVPPAPVAAPLSLDVAPLDVPVLDPVPPDAAEHAKVHTAIGIANAIPRLTSSFDAVNLMSLSISTRAVCSSVARRSNGRYKRSEPVAGRTSPVHEELETDYLVLGAGAAKRICVKE